jgi:F-type H+-transporting ATPase subunit c
MLEFVKLIGAGLISTGLIVTRIGKGIVFGSLIVGVSINPYLRSQLFSYAIL